MKVDELLSLLQKAKPIGHGEHEALCPAHPDKNPSLHIKEQDGKILINCKAGCATESILDALNLIMSDLFVTKMAPKEIVATYDYQDEDGSLLFQVVRYSPKAFLQRHRNGAGEWVWNLEGIKRVIYHLPEILNTDGPIYFVEGEKDADAIWERGFVATTSPMGANSWRPEYASFLEGKHVIIIPDNDTAGMDYARTAAKALVPVSASVKCAILPNAKDFADWITRHDIEELPGLTDDISRLFSSEKPQYKNDGAAIIWNINDLTFKASGVQEERTGIHGRISIHSEYQELAWSRCNIEKSEERVRLANQAKKGDEEIRRNLDAFCAGLWDFQVSSLAPEVMIGDENITAPTFFLYPYVLRGGGSILFAPPGRGKSYSALLWAQSINTGTTRFWRVQKAPVLYINLERSSESMRRRLTFVNKTLGLRAEQPILAFHARGKSLSHIEQSVVRAIQKWGIKVIFLDSMSRAGMGDLSDNRTGNAIIDILNNLCETWVALGHTPRKDEEHLYGSIMQDAGADITIRLRSQTSEHTLGIAYELDKKNDLPDIPPEIWALEFEEWRLKTLRKAKPHEFSDIEIQKQVSMTQQIIEYILGQDTADATTIEVANDLGFSRTAVSVALNRSGKFVKTRKDGRKQFFGVKTGDVQSTSWGT